MKDNINYPLDLKKVIEDTSIIVSQDQKVFEVISDWSKPKCSTESGPEYYYEQISQGRK